jgi:tetratricopeptide (TPR) repeat protein
VPWLLRAAEVGASLGAYRDALATLELIRPSARGEDAARLLALQADLLSACGDLGAVDAYRAALAAATQPPLRARLRTRLARTATQHGDLETAAAALEGLQPDGSSNDGDLLVTRGHLAMWRGDLTAAADAAEEAQRRLALDASTDGRLFHLVTLQGLLAHFRGQWFQRLRAELRTGARRPDLAAGLFDSHLCVAEFLLYGPTPYDEVLRLADELCRTAERAGVPRAVAFAVALRGEAALLKGDLALAEAELARSAELHHSLEFPGGEAHSLQRLAEVHVQRGDRAAALPLLQRALPLARWAIFGRCLLPRIYGTMIDAAGDPDEAVAVVERAEATLGVDEQCPFCGIMLAVPAARACAAAGDLPGARRWFGRAETVEARWEGTSWEASLLEVRGLLARAEGDERQARRLLLAAAGLFDGSGQPLDAVRCRATAEGSAPDRPGQLPVGAGAPHGAA